jgi:hypothetical protein
MSLVLTSSTSIMSRLDAASRVRALVYDILFADQTISDKVFSSPSEY